MKNETFLNIYQYVCQRFRQDEYINKMYIIPITLIIRQTKDYPTENKIKIQKSVCFCFLLPLKPIFVCLDFTTFTDKG